MSLRAELETAARALGFDAVGVASAAEPWLAAARLAEFVEAGRHGDMEWMARTAERRAHPQAMWPDARSAVMVGVNYGPRANPLEALARKDHGAISVYAQGGDYHDLIKKRLKQLAGRLVELTGADVKVFVDTAPLMEKPLAERAGLGWQGKHTNLVSRAQGSWLFLGAVLTSAELAPDAPETDHCGSCTACLDICPTDAFPGAYRLDARRCLAYLSIEHQGQIPRDMRAAMGNRVYGCDDCLAVCPWNKFAAATREVKLQARVELTAPRLIDLARLDEEGFRALFSGTAVKRTGRDRFVRNVVIALGNSRGGAARAEAERLLDDASPLVRGAAVWAVWRLAPLPDFERLSLARAATEPDTEVRAEWAACLSASRGEPSDLTSASA